MARNQRWSYELLDSNDQIKRPLTEVVGGSLEGSMFTRIEWGGRLECVFTGEPDIDWGSDRIRVLFSPSRDVEPYPMGVMLIEAPTVHYNDDAARREYRTDINLVGKLTIPDADALEDTLAIPAGNNVIASVQNVLASTGETKFSLTESPQTLASSLAWEPGTSKLDVCNDLLDLINYGPLWCDWTGTFKADPYVDPGARPVRYRFHRGQVDGVPSRHLPEWSRTQDWWDIPNRVVLTTRGDLDEPALRAVASDINPESPYSYQARGRWIVQSDTGVEASDLDTLAAIANRKLTSAQYRVTNLEVTHALVQTSEGTPLWLRDRVTFEGAAGVVDATVSKMSFPLTPSALVKGDWRQVIS